MLSPFFLIIPGICYLLTSGLILLDQFKNIKSGSRIITGLIWSSLTIHIILLMLRFYQMPETMFTGVREFAVALSALLVIGYLITARWLRGLGIAGAVMCVAGLILITTAPSLLYQPQAVPLILCNPLLLIHVPLVLLAYLAFALAAMGSIMYLVISDLLKARRPIAISPKLPTLNSLEEFNQRMTKGGFLFLSGGIILGMIWSSSVWHTLIPQSPKMLLALVTWAIYAVYFYLMHARKIRGRYCAWLLIIGFILIIAGLLAPVIMDDPHNFI